MAVLPVPPLHEQKCSLCREWNTPQTPFRIFGNTYYVGPHGLTVLLIKTAEGDALIDGGIRESAPLVAENIKALGFRLTEIKLILNSHVHHDHAGGIAELQRLTGAEVVASPASAEIMRTGGVARDDPQFGNIRGVDPIARVRTLKPGESIQLGTLTLTPHPTPGHTRGGTSWTWTTCEGARCERMVYVDSITAVSRPGFRFSAHPELGRELQDDFAWLRKVPCDVLITPHPEASDLFERVRSGSLVDSSGCAALAERGEKAWQERVSTEARGAPR